MYKFYDEQSQTTQPLQAILSSKQYLSRGIVIYYRASRETNGREHVSKLSARQQEVTHTNAALFHERKSDFAQIRFRVCLLF